MADPSDAGDRLYQCQFCGQFDVDVKEHTSHVNSAHRGEWEVEYSASIGVGWLALVVVVSALVVSWVVVHYV